MTHQLSLIHKKIDLAAKAKLFDLLDVTWKLLLQIIDFGVWITVKPEMLAAIIFGGFENITIWLRFNLAISLKESGWGSI